MLSFGKDADIKLLEHTQALRSFLDSLDVTVSNWKSVAESWFLDEIRKAYHQEEKPKSRRFAQFSVGDDQEDEIADNVNESCTSTQDAETQCNLQPTLENTIIKITQDGSLDDIKLSWKNGKDVQPGDALRLLNRGYAKQRELESRFDNETAIAIRRSFVAPHAFNFKELPYKNYDYEYVTQSCCENVIGYMPIPVGVAGPLIIKNRRNEKRNIYVPMATTEGALIASTNRGCSAILKSGGIKSIVHEEKMTRAPVVRFPSIDEAIDFKDWLEDPTSFNEIKTKFESTSRFAKLMRIDCALNGNEVFVRFSALTGDAMGMNMVSKACSTAINALKEQFPSMEVVALSGNYCVDKKASALNWIDGRGRSVISECVLPAKVVQEVLKTTAKDMAAAALAKLQHGSNMAGCIGGNNAHAANIVAAIFIATGQDAAQVVSSSMCCTRMEETMDGDLYVSCTMPCVEVGTVGGGTILPPQKECLQMLSCAGPASTRPGDNACSLAEVIAATVLAGELSLMAALVTDQLVSSHMRLNRSRMQLYPDPPKQSSAMPTFPPVERREREHFRVKKNSERERAGCSNIL